MKEVLVVLKKDSPKAARDAQKRIENRGGHIRQRYGKKVLIVAAADPVIKEIESDQGVAGVYPGQVPEEFSQRLDDTGQIGIAAWNQRHSEAFRQAKEERKGEGLAWDHPDFDPEGRQEP